MLPLILAVVGGYLVGDSMKDKAVFDEGGFLDDGGENYRIHYTRVYEDGQLGDTVYTKTIYSTSENGAKKIFLKKYPNYQIDFVSKDYSGYADGGMMAKGGKVNSSIVDELWRGYAEAVLFTETDMLNGYIEDEPLIIYDFDEKTVKETKKMLASFYSKNKKAIERSGLDLNTIGNDVWYTRSGQGAGFFDHSLEDDVEKQLIEGAAALGEFPTVELYDGKISIRGGRVFADGGMMAKGGGINKGEFYEGQSVIYDITNNSKLDKSVRNLFNKYANKELVIDKIEIDKPYNTAKVFDKNTGEKISFDIILNPRYVKEYVKDLGFPSKSAPDGSKARMAYLMVKGKLGVKIKDFYTETYPTDDLGEQLNDDVTFKDLWDGLHGNKNVYDVMGVGDSVIRERLFEELAEITGLDYKYIYDLWLKSDYAEGGMMAKGGNINYIKKWKVVYITMQGKMGKKEISLGRMSNEQDVKNALRRMPDLNIREVTLIEEIKEYGGMMAKGGEVGFENSNLYLNGFGLDSNGNSVVKVSFPNQRAFSIQTNGVLKETNNLYTKNINELTQSQIKEIEKEVVEYVKKFGSKEQKQKLKTYSSYADGGVMTKGRNISIADKKLKEAAKKYNAQIKKEIKIMESGLTEGGNKNKILLRELSKNK